MTEDTMRSELLRNGWEEGKPGQFTCVKGFDYWDKNNCGIDEHGHKVEKGRVQIVPNGVTRNLADAYAIEVNRPKKVVA